MHHYIRNASLVLGLGLGLAGAQAQASTITLPLGNLKSGAAILSYFNGGSDSLPLTDGTGPDLGIEFSPNATAQKAGTTSTSAGRFENEPSNQGEVLFFNSANGVMNAVDGGFTSLSFDYSVSGNKSNLGATPAYQSATVSIWSGLDGTGTLLDTLTLTPVADPAPCANNQNVYCNWSLATTAGTTFSQVARSVTFGATTAESLTEFDNIQFAPVPLPAAAWLMLSGLTGLFGFVRRQRRAA